MSEIKDKPRKPSLNYALSLWIINIYFYGIIGFWMLIFEAKWSTVLYVIFLILFGCIGVTIGGHRYFAHRAFEANGSLVNFFILGHTIAGVGPLFDWIRYHRLHHKYIQTDKDPYFTHKGFLYNHFWSNLLKPTLTEYEIKKEIDMRDIDDFMFVSIQRQFYWIFYAVVTIFIPLCIATEFLNENVTISIFAVVCLRLAITWNISALVNSSILVWGLKPGDRYPVANNSIFFLNKSYWMNYHYLLPWDWKSTEFGKYDEGLSIILIKILKHFNFLTLPKTISSQDIRNALIKFANKDLSWEETVIQLRKQSEDKAIKKKLVYKH